MKNFWRNPIPLGLIAILFAFAFVAIPATSAVLAPRVTGSIANHNYVSYFAWRPIPAFLATTGSGTDTMVLIKDSSSSGTRGYFQTTQLRSAGSQYQNTIDLLPDSLVTCFEYKDDAVDAVTFGIRVEYTSNDTTWMAPSGTVSTTTSSGVRGLSCVRSTFMPNMKTRTKIFITTATDTGYVYRVSQYASFK